VAASTVDALKAERPLHLLTIGGLRGFTSTYFVQRAVERGHRVTILTRGVRTAPGEADADVPPGVEVIVGDRHGDLARIEGRGWDAAVDFGAFRAEDVDAMTEALRGRVGHYTFISSVAAYRPDPGPLDEDSALFEAPEPGSLAASNWLVQYGFGKVESERRAAAFEGSTLIIRPGFIVGPHDPNGHLQYWGARWARGGDIAIPGDPSDRVQFVDSRDLAPWILDMIERDQAGTYNAASSRDPITRGELMDLIAGEFPGRARAVWLPSDWLTSRGIRCQHSTFWIKPDGLRGDDEFWLSQRVSDARARAQGLRPRLAAETIHDAVAALRHIPEAQRTWAGPFVADLDLVGLVADWRSRRARRSPH
jgi:2'-hydroxyisoflavone reductase